MRENWAIIRWKQAMNREAWRLVHADGGNRCGPEQYERARQSLIAKGYPPPPDIDEPRPLPPPLPR